MIEPAPSAVETSSAGTHVGGLSFDAIAPTYDFLNHLLSLGCDFAWRRRVARFLARQKPARVVDLATGTGDLAIALLQQGCGAEELVGLDISEPMLPPAPLTSTLLPRR